MILDKAEGSFSTSLKKLKLVFHSIDVNSISIDGRDSNLASIKHSYFSPMEKYDPINDPESMGEEDVKMAEMDYSMERMEISW